MLFANFQKGRGDTSQNDERIVDSRMQIRFIACGYPIYFAICKRVVDSLLKCCSRVVDTLLKGFACGLHYWFDYSLAFARPLGEFEFELKIDRATETIINHQRHSPKLGLLIQTTLSPSQTDATVPLIYIRLVVYSISNLKKNNNSFLSWTYIQYRWVDTLFVGHLVTKKTCFLGYHQCCSWYNDNNIHLMFVLHKNNC